MERRIAIRKETKNQWERRTPLVPKDVKELIEKHNIEVLVEPSDLRIYTDEEYRKVGAAITNELCKAPIIFGVKEIPPKYLEPQKIYVFFSHVIKGQKYNMPMLKRLIDLGCTLIDYEKVTDEKGRRLIFFGRFAGLAGMVDTLWILGKKLKKMGISSPFENIKQTIEYRDLAHVKEELAKVAEEIKKNGLPDEIVPFVVGIAGYGHVSQGAQEILDILPHEVIKPEELPEIDKKAKKDRVYKVVFKEEHMVEPLDPKQPFELFDYYNHPEKYRGVFHKYVPYMRVLVNAIYWDERYPRLVTREFIKKHFKEDKPRLLVIGDISCDIEGAIEFTVKATDPGDPAFTYFPLEDKVEDGVYKDGITVLAVDILPAELAKDASDYFSSVLKEFVPSIVNADYSRPFEEIDLPDPIKKAVIVYRGELTPDYQYLKKFLEGVS